MCLSQHPIFPVYLSVASIVSNKDKWDEAVEEMGDMYTGMHMFFQNLKTDENFDLQAVIDLAVEFTEKIEPEELVSKCKFEEDSPFTHNEMS